MEKEAVARSAQLTSKDKSIPQIRGQMAFVQQPKKAASSDILRDGGDCDTLRLLRQPVYTNHLAG